MLCICTEYIDLTLNGFVSLCLVHLNKKDLGVSATLVTCMEIAWPVSHAVILVYLFVCFFVCFSVYLFISVYLVPI